MNVNKPTTLSQFLKELSLQHGADFKCKTQIIIYDSIGNEIYDSLETGTLISDFELFEHLDDQVKKAYETDYGEYLLIEIFLEKN